MKKPCMWVAIVMGIGALLAVSAVAFPPTRWALVEMAVGNRSLHVSCDKLPTVDHVREALASKPEEWQQVQAIASYAAVDERRCPGRAYVKIEFAAIRQKNELVKIMDSAFPGIPYTLTNV